MDSYSLLKSKNEELGGSILIGTGVYDFLVSLILIGGTFMGETGTYASSIAYSLTCAV